MMDPMNFAPFLIRRKRQYPADITQNRIGLTGLQKTIMRAVMEKDENSDQQRRSHNRQAQNEPIRNPDSKSENHQHA